MGGKRTRTTDRAQAYTLEGLVSAIILVSAVLYGMQAVDAAAWTGGTADTEVENLRTQAKDTLAVADQNGTLHASVTCLNGSSNGSPHHGLAHKPTRFDESDEYNVTNLGRVLNRTFPTDEFDYNLYFEYWDPDDDQREQVLVYPNVRQAPDENSVSVTHRVTLYDSTHVSWNSVDEDHGCRNHDAEIGDVSGLYVEDVATGPNENLYNIVEVRLVVW
jgi:hypothetical protein